MKRQKTLGLCIHYKIAYYNFYAKQAKNNDYFLRHHHILSNGIALISFIAIL